MLFSSHGTNAGSTERRKDEFTVHATGRSDSGLVRQVMPATSRSADNIVELR